jgi:hypothetical protein
MAVINPVGYLHNRSDHTGQTDRLAGGAGLLLPDAVGSLRPVGGVRAPTDMTVAYVSGTDITVSAGIAYVPQGQSPLGGAYELPNDGTITLTLGARHATLTRYDLIVARVQDDFYSGTQKLGDIVPIAGTAASTPTDPSLPAGASYLVLGRVIVPPTGPLLLVRLVKQVQVPGAVPVVDVADTTPGLWAEQMRVHPTLGLQRWNGTAWVRQFGDTGWVAIPFASGWAGGSMAYRIVQGICWVRINSTHASFTSGTLVCTLPPEARPGSAVFPTGSYNGVLISLNINPDGTITTVNPTAAAGVTLTTDYPLDS